jgi:signal peptidase II
VPALLEVARGRERAGAALRRGHRATEESKLMPSRYKLFGFVSLLTIVLDQLTKWWAREELIYGQNVSFIGDIWHWRLSYNTGSAFGLFSGATGSRIFLSVIGVGAAIFILFVLKKAHDHQKWMNTSLALIAGGAIGNVIDRIIDAKVTDFVVWRAGTYEWPAFNIADVALVVGVAIMFLDVGRDQKRQREIEERAKAATKSPAR